MFEIKMFYNLLQENYAEPYDEDYQLIIDYAILQGWSLPSNSTKSKDNTLIINLKSSGVWYKLDVFYMFSTDGDSNFASINWKNPGTYDATIINTVTFVSNSGFIGDGISGYISTNFNPSNNGVNYQLDDASRYFWKGNTAAGLMDGNNATNLQIMQTAATGNQRINQTAQISSGYGYGTTIGLKSIHRTSSTNVTLITNTTVATRTAASSTTNYSQTQWILRGNINTYTTHLVRMYSMGASLVSENTDYYNTINTRLS